MRPAKGEEPVWSGDENAWVAMDILCPNVENPIRGRRGNPAPTSNSPPGPELH
jgi:hypothetical protein